MNRPVNLIFSPLDLTTNEGIAEAQKSMERQLRETRQALAAIELVIVTQQLLAGLCTAEEALRKAAAMIVGLPVAQPGDLDYITGLRLPTLEEIEAAEAHRLSEG